jgi:hypothetical protein
MTLCSAFLLLNEGRADLAQRFPPDVWKLSWSFLQQPVRREVMVRLMEGPNENLSWSPRYESYLREHAPPTLIVWSHRTGICLKPPLAPAFVTCPRWNCTCWTVDSGRWRPILRRSSGTFAIS